MKKEMLKLLSIFAIAICLVSCGESGGDYKGDSLTLTPDEEELAGDLVQFQKDFFKAVCEVSAEDENVVVSPLSAQVLLSMMSNACSGEALTEILAATGCDDAAELNAYCSKVLPVLPKRDKKVSMSIANSVWYHSDYELAPAFTSVLGNFYSASTYKRDFDNTSETVGDINGWCASNTSDMIRNFITTIKPEHKLIVLNTLFFNGEWTSPFDKANTKKQTFYGLSATSEVDMMNLKSEKMNYAMDKGFQAVRKSFGCNDAFSVWLVLPDEGASLDIDADWFVRIGGYFEPCTIDLSLPKFRIESSTIDFKVPFKKLGIKTMFESSGFLPFTVDVSGKWEADQKVVVEFDEEGAKVAAASKANGMDMEVVLQHHKLVFDRPFLFYITENTTSSIVAAGRIVNL